MITLTDMDIIITQANMPLFSVINKAINDIRERVGNKPQILILVNNESSDLSQIKNASPVSIEQAENILTDNQDSEINYSAI
jgi:hypothetical protein